MTTIDIAFAKEWPTYEPIVRQATNENMRIVMEALFANAFVAGFDHCMVTRAKAIDDVKAGRQPKVIEV